MFKYSELGIKVISDTDATVASVFFEDRMFTGASKRNPRDKYNEEIGVELAVSRMFGKIARHLARRANGAVKHADDMRAERQRRLKLPVPYSVTVEHNHARAAMMTDGSCPACRQILTGNSLPDIHGRHERPVDWRALLMEMIAEDDAEALRAWEAVHDERR